MTWEKTRDNFKKNKLRMVAGSIAMLAGTCSLLDVGLQTFAGVALLLAGTYMYLGAEIDQLKSDNDLK